MCEEGVEEGTQHAAMMKTNVQDECLGGEIFQFDMLGSVGQKVQCPIA